MTRGVAGLQRQLRHDGQLEEQHVPGASTLRPGAGEHGLEHVGMRDVHDDETIERTRAADREGPGDRRAPVVADQQPAARAERVEQCRRVVDEVAHAIGVALDRPVAVAVAAQIGGDRVPAHLGQRLELVAPRKPTLGEAMQAERDVVARARLVDGEAQAVRRQDACRNPAHPKFPWQARLTIKARSSPSAERFDEFRLNGFLSSVQFRVGEGGVHAR